MNWKHGTAAVLSICLAGLSSASPSELAKEERRIRRTADRRTRPIRPADPTAKLTSFADCQELRSYFIEVAVETLIEHRYHWWYMIPWAGPEDGRDVSDVPNDYTTTNNQVQGVDEIDIVKTNGTHLYATEGDTLHVLRSWPSSAAAQVAAARIGLPSWGLFLHQDLAVTASGFYEPDVEFPRPPGAARFEIFDISDPSSPRSTRTVDVEGWLVDARLIDGDLYAVIRTFIDYPPELWDLIWGDDIGLPDEIPWDASEEERERILAEARNILTPLVTEILEEYSIGDFLPQLRDRSAPGDDTAPRNLVDCGSLFRPAEVSDWAVLSVLHLDLDDPGPVTAAGLVADGWTVYASRNSLYVAQTSDWWWWGFAPTEMRMTTAIHKFELDPSRPSPVSYSASGTVDGWILDQFSLSEHDGYLRVAATDFDWWWGTTPEQERASSVTVLADDGGGNLREMGHVGGLGPGEQIFAVRFMGEKAYVVTFERIDPLFTLDLEDPMFPKVVGELEVTGFSSYLHPIGDDWLLAVGQEADEEGRVLGLAVSIFDVRDFANPALAHRYLIESDEDTWSWSEAMDDHHAFTYHRGVLSIPAYISGANGRFSGLLVLAVDPEDGIRELGRIDHQDLTEEDGHAWMRRSVYIEDAIYSLSSAGVKVNSLSNPEVEIAAIPFAE